VPGSPIVVAVLGYCCFIFKFVGYFGPMWNIIREYYGVWGYYY
jgi:hypothetical protein